MIRLPRTPAAHRLSRWQAGALALALATAPGAAEAAPAVAALQPPRIAAPERIEMGRISIEVRGEGSPVILIPGLSSPRAVWDGIAPDLARKHRVYLVQVRGFGGEDTGDNLAPGVLDGMVADLHALIVREKLAGVPVIGHSMGGLVALMLARAHPGDAGRLLIVDALPFIGTLFDPNATAASIQPMAARQRDAMAATYGKPADEAMLRQIARTNALKPESQAQVIAWVRAADPRVSALALYEDMTTDLRGALPSIATPITLLYPSSQWLPADRADAVYGAAYAAAPQATLKRIDDSGHFLMLDQPEKFAEAVAAFLTE